MSTTSSTSTTNTGTSKAAVANKPLHEHPVGALVVGLLLLFFALWGISVQLTTSEAWFMGRSVTTSIVPYFGILGQPVLLLQGRLSGLQLEAFTYAWGVEVVQFFLSTGLVFAMLKHNRVVSWICLIGCLAVMVLDSLSDFFFNAAANGWQQAGFTLVVFLMAFGLTYYALHLILVKGILAWIKHP
jgi:hypothetical protein